MGWVLVFLLTLWGSGTITAQTTLINPAGDGGFESGATFAANGWSVANSPNNPWTVGALSNGLLTGNAAFVSDNGTTPSYSTAGTCSNYFWRDVTVPAGESKIKLDFNWASQGEASWDIWQVFIAPTSVVPVAGAHPGSGPTAIPTAIAGSVCIANGSPQTGVQSLTMYLPTALAGTTFRLIFHWKSDTSLGTQPPAAIDNISLVSAAPGNYTSIASGAWSSNATWNLGSVPGALDNATIASGTSVNVDAAGQTANNVVVNGVLGYTATPTSFTVLGNLTVNATGVVNVFSGTTGKTITVAGNIINDGIMDVSVGATTAGNLTLNGTDVQTVSGSGSFAMDVIRNLTFSNTNTATPNVNWLLNNVKIANNLSMTGARVNLGTNKMTFGNFAAGGTLTAPIGTGFLPGGKFSRWWTALATGSLIAAGSDPTNTTSRYPFLSASGANRAMYISRTTATDAVAGEMAVTYNDATTVTTGLAIADDAYQITDRYNGNWVVSTEGTPVYSSSYRIVLVAQNAMVPLNGNARILNATAVLAGAHQNGSTTPGAQRINVTQTDLLAGALYLGINAADVPFTSIANGAWNAATTWNKGVVPSCSDVVTIGAGTTVTSSSVNSAKGIIIVNGGTLAVASGTLTVGCTLNNSSLVNNGILTVAGGALTINGNLLVNAGGTFNQLGGLITVDGNDNGILANSVPKLTSIVKITASGVANLNLTGGTLVVVDPHADNSTSDYGFVVSQGGATNAAGPLHTLQFGNGISTAPGGHTNGLNFYLYQGTYYYSLGNVTSDLLTGVNRFVKSLSSIGIAGNLTITSGEYQLASNHIVSGNVVNNGILTSGSLLAMATFSPPSSILPAVNAQAISGTGVFRNLPVDPTANLTSFQVSNSNATGVTLNVPLSVSGTLTMNEGFIKTTNTNLLTLGTATTTGTLSGTPSATTLVKGPFARTILNGNTTFVSFPIGKSGFAPLSLAPSTTAVSVVKAEAFDTNTGTANAAISNLSTTRRWATSLVSGAFSDIKVRMGDASIVETSVPVQAPSAAGVYTSTFGSVATFTAGTPNQIESPNAILAANYTGFLSFAQANACSGTPAPGVTLASSTTICLGASVTLSLQNGTAGTGVTFQWKSSPDGVTYTAIDGATAAILNVVPTAATFYKCDVTCASGATTGSSTPVQITFTNSITSTVPGARCGVGSVNLAATPNAGATVQWYAGLLGGVALGTGTAFTTPSIESTTTYYAAASTATSANITLGAGATTATSYDGIFYHLYGGAQTQFLVRASELIALGFSAGNINSLGINMASANLAYAGFAVSIASTTTATTTGFVTDAFTSVYNSASFAPTVGLNTFTFSNAFPWDGVSNIVVKFCWSNNNGGGTSSFAKVDNPGFVCSAYQRADNVTPASICGNAVSYGTSSLRPQFIFNGQVGCVSARVPVIATVSSPPVLTLSTATVVICKESASAAVTVTSNAADFDSYVWTPATGVSGDATTGWSFSPTEATTYTLTAAQTTGSLCAATATVAITVNPIPSALAFVPTAPAVCVDGILPLSVTGGTLGAAGKIGTGIISNTTSTPYKGYWGGTKTQSLYTAAELTALGMVAGQQISSIGFVALSGTPNELNGFTIQAGFVANTTISGGFLTGAGVVVQAPSAYTASTGTGNLDYALATPLLWDGVSNLLVETCFNNNNGGGISANSIAVESSTVASGLHVYFSADSNAAVCASATATTSTTRPNLRVTALAGTEIAWSPATHLFTDAAATVPYVSGASTSAVYFKSNAAGSTTYTVTASTALSCSVASTVAVVVNALPTLVLHNAMPLCFGGTADLTAAAVTSGSDAGLAFTYFSDAAGTLPLTNPTAVGVGTYYIVGTNGSGCTTMGMVTVTQPALLSASISMYNDVSCNGGLTGNATGFAAGGTAPYTYSWNTGASTASLSGVGAGAYMLTVTDANGCSATASITITEPAALVASIAGQTDVLCNGGSTGAALVAVTGGTAPYTYVWSNGTTTAALSGVAAGTYTVAVTDGNGCMVTVGVTLTQPTALGTSIAQQTNVSCNGGQNGSATAVATGGTAPYMYLWNTGVSTALLSDVSAGIYTVTVTDLNGCSVTATVAITQPIVLLASIGTPTQVACNGGATGAATASVSGGTAPYAYAWNTGATTATLSNVGAGSYTVIVTDAKGCTAIASVTITEPAALVASVAVPTAISCNGAANAVLTTSVTGGATPYTYLWSNAATTATLSGVGPGVYTVTVTDGNGCMVTSSIAVTEPTALVASIALQANVSCNGAMDGAATVMASGGTAPYGYLWSFGPSTPTNSGMGAGTYTVIVTDSANCVTTVTVTITEPAALVASISNQMDITCTNGAGSATAVGAGGTAPYTYSWSNGATGAVLSGVGVGTYTATITDAKGCTATTSVTFTQGAGIALVVNDPAATCGDAVDLTAAAVTAGSEMGITFAYFMDAAATLPLTNPSAIATSGVYYIKGTSAAGCVAVLAVTVTVNVTGAPTGAALQDFTTGQTLADFTVGTASGAALTWYTSSTGSVVLPSNTVLISGTTYYASQTVAGCESTGRLAVTAGADLVAPSFEINNLRYYPNPVLDVLNVSYSEAIQGVQLYNMLGQLVYNRSTSSALVQIDMTSLATGTYILEVTVKGIVKNVKVIKN